MEREKQKPVVVKLSKTAGVENTENLRLYVVSAGGKITETAQFRGNEATLNASRESLEGQSKLYVAQALPEGIQSNRKNEQTLLKMNAYQAVKNFNGSDLTISRLPSSVIDHFPFFNCLVTGHVSKNFSIDGQTKNLPLCDLRVHICEVETELRLPHIPIYYGKIPDWVIQELAEKIVNYRPDPIGPVSNAKINLPLSSLTEKRSLQRTAKAPSVNLPENVVNNLLSGSVDIQRQTMIDFHDILYPYFCFWPYYWPFIYVSEEVAVVTTDCNGHFDAWLFNFGRNNPLNIYIWIEANINGQWVTVYRPALPCHTRWGYQCNTDISILVTDPRLQPCNCGVDGPADAVWFRSIGLSASALHIEQSLLSTVNVQGLNVLNAGCTDIVNGTKISPFGGGLDFKLFCGADIFNAGVTHYRWKYTQIADANATPIPVGYQTTNIIQGTVTRPYLVKLSAVDYKTHYATLGPEGTGTDIAYRIPHQDITAEIPSVIPTADQNLSPTWEDIFFDSAYIDSHSLTDGVYRFDLELLRHDAAGFHVVPVARPTFRVSEVNSILDNQAAPDAYMRPTNPLLMAQSLSFNVRVDNAPCVAKIHDAELLNMNGPNAFSGPCGFIKYTDPSQNVQISFEASQPRNFATFNFGIVKGNGTQPTGINISGAYVGSSVDISSVISGVTGTFALAGGLFSDNFTVGTLLNGCPGQAAFSENLYVASLATDGTYRLQGLDYTDSVTHVSYYYDPSDVNAFALSNT